MHDLTADFFRRPKDRSSHDTELAGQVRFFKTVAGPDDTVYPATGLVYYARLLKDVTFTKTPGSPSISSTETDEYAYLGNLTGKRIPEGTKAVAQKIGARWWIKGTVGDGDDSGGGCDCCNPFNCIDPGAALDECPICTCSADPWVIGLGTIDCGGASVGGGHPLFLDGDASSADACIWTENEFTSDERTFQWKLTVTSDLTATVQLIETTDEAQVLAHWTMDDFCCKCENSFEASCPNYFPVPCDGLPAKICVRPPVFEEARVPFNLCGAVDPPDGCEADGEMAGVWDFTIEPGTLTGDIFLATPQCQEFQRTWHLKNRGEVTTEFENGPCIWLQHFDSEADGGGEALDHAASGPGALLSLDAADLTLVFGWSDDFGTFAARYSMPREDFQCLGDNVLTLDNDEDFCAGWPATLTLTPGDALTIDGSTFYDYLGNLVTKPDHEECDPDSNVLCQCRWFWTDPGVWVFYATEVPCGTGDPPQCCDCPDPPDYDGSFFGEEGHTDCIIVEC